MQRSSQIVTTNKPTPRAGYPSCRPTNSVRALKGNCSLLIYIDYTYTRHIFNSFCNAYQTFNIPYISMFFRTFNGNFGRVTGSKISGSDEVMDQDI